MDIQQNAKPIERSMQPLFCAVESRESGADMIGTAPEHQVYVAIECPPPWTPSEIESPGVPDNLRSLAADIGDNYDHYQARFLLIANEQLRQQDLTRVLVFRKRATAAVGYERQEFHLPSIEAVASLVRHVVMGEQETMHPSAVTSRDILICTHGSRDRCCSRFGAPIFHHARKRVDELKLENTRIWQASHIGGHRMAPTAIDFPSARYYGYLDKESIEAVLTQSGDIQCMKTIYRGWGLLPWAAQVLEQHLLLSHGWDWLSYGVTAEVLEHDEEELYNRVALTYQPPGGEAQRVEADVVADEGKAVKARSSCASDKASWVIPYKVSKLGAPLPADGVR